MKKLNVAILGCGTVGGGTYDILLKNHDLIQKRTGADIRVTRILDIRHREDIPEELYTANIDEIFADPEIDCVVETLGGIEPSTSFMLGAMKAGKHVISANKAAIANSWQELNETAKDNDVQFLFEASVGGGIPVLTAIRGQLQGNNFLEVMGIVNGTTNYILTKMTEEGASYEDVLKDAQEKGFAEKDPTADVDGIDAANKLSILIALLFGQYIAPMDIPRCGIRHITQLDIAEAEMKGEKIKLIAHAILKDDGTIKCSVKPEGIPKSHPLAGVSNEYNAVYVVGDMVGETMFYGKGAGALPTGAAIVGDIISLVK
ncbi:MAG: homoserine dehydrogenase [Firmicutes bacterium]|nr:homoserine dehydrogenase [Bacillota bacterium]